MEAAIAYFVKVNLYFIAFFGCYWLLFRKLTFFRWNRFYLLGSLIAALLLPLVTITETLTIDAQTESASSVIAGDTRQIVQENIISWPIIATAAYVAGVLIMLSFFVRSLVQITKTIRSGEKYQLNDYQLVISDQPQSGSFSFFKWLVISRRDFHATPDTVIMHEQVHIRQWHSVDIVFAELLKACFWINPVTWFYKSALQITHEYLADEVADNRDQYASFLVSYDFGLSPQTLQNSFLNSSQLKSRIQMMYTRRTSPWSLAKYVLVLPIIAVLVFSTAARQYEVLPLLSPVTPAAASYNMNVSGTVVDENGKGIAGATVVVKNGNAGASTDQAGKFTLNDIPENSTLVASHVAYLASELDVHKNTTDYKFVLKPAQTNVLTAGTESQNAAPQPKATSKSGAVFTVVEQNATFPGGEKGLAEYIKTNLKYPEPALKANVSGIVVMVFRVDGEGNVGAVRIAKGIGFGADAESVRLVKNMPKWNPAVQNGKPVSVEQTIEVKFDLEKEKASKQQGFFIQEHDFPFNKFKISNVNVKNLFGISDKVFDANLLTDESAKVKTPADTTRYRYLNYRYPRSSKPYAYGFVANTTPWWY